MIDSPEAFPVLASRTSENRSLVVHYIPVWCAPVLAVFYIIHIILYYMVPSIYLYLHLCMSLMLVGEERRRVAPRRHFLTGWGF